MDRSKPTRHSQSLTATGATKGSVKVVCGAIDNTSGACEINRMNTLNSGQYTAADVAKTLLPDVQWDGEDSGRRTITCKQYRHCSAAVTYRNGMLSMVCTNTGCKRKRGFCVGSNILESIAKQWNKNTGGQVSIA